MMKNSLILQIALITMLAMALPLSLSAQHTPSTSAEGSRPAKNKNGLVLQKSMLPPLPAEVGKRPIASVKMGDINSFDEVQLDLPITEGPFQPNWESIEANYPGTPEWLREAKFGI